MRCRWSSDAITMMLILPAGMAWDRFGLGECIRFQCDIAAVDPRYPNTCAGHVGHELA